MYDLISEVVETDGSIGEKRIELDFSRLAFIEPTGVTVLSNLIELVKKLGGDITYSGYRINGQSARLDPIAYLDDSLFFKRYVGATLQRQAQLRSTTAELTLVSHAKSFMWLENDLIPWISDKAGVGKSSLASIKVCFQEVFNNIKDHSTVDVGCIFGQFYPKKNEMQIAISDFGIGIPANVRKLHPELSDGECIKLATQEGFTTRTGKNNRGAGLDVLIKNVVNNNGGNLIIHSGTGMLSCIQDGRNVKKTPRTAGGYYPGTLLQVTFMTNRFSHFDDEEEVFEWSS